MLLQHICLWMAFTLSVHNTPKQNTENNQFHVMRMIFLDFIKNDIRNQGNIWNLILHQALKDLIWIFYIYQFKLSNQFCRLAIPNFLHRYSSLILLEKHSQHFTIIWSFFHYFLQGGLPVKGTGSSSHALYMHWSFLRSQFDSLHTLLTKL